MRSAAVWRVTSLAMVVACGFGCGGAVQGPNEKLYSVKGTITLDGKPLEGAAVSFVPVQSKTKQAHPSYGQTDSAGKYSLKNAQAKAGIFKGEYRIAVSKMVQQDGSPLPPDSPGGDADGLQLVPWPHWSQGATKNIAVVEDKKEEQVFDVAMTSGENKEPVDPRARFRSER